MAKTSIEELAEFGQSAWLDNINRSMIEDGSLQKMIDVGLRGLTSNPSIFDKAISKSNMYDKAIEELRRTDKSNFEIYDDLTVKDIQDAADLFRPVYEKTNGLDGYVSLEINPKLAFQTKETIEEGKRLYQKVNRPNVMFKVPSTDEGFAAVEEFTARGMNINITLIFSLQQYIKTAQAYRRGIERYLAKKGNVRKVRSVASVFISRIDTLVDTMLDELVKKAQDQQKIDYLHSLKGKAAVANTQIIYKKFLDTFSSDEFKQIWEKGANPQRVLWGSTSTKNPAYSDIKYVTELIGKNTVNTIPENTFKAFLDYGTVKQALSSDDSYAQKIIDDLKGVGIDIDEVCKKLLQDGVVAFAKSFDSLLNSIEEKARSVCVK